MVRVTVPATSANMGSGYDSIGIALELYNVIDLAENDHIDISDKNGQYVPQDESNLIYQCAKRVYDECGKPLSGLTIVEDCAIPQTRGLGSSSACTVAGIMGANMLLGEPLDRNAVIDLAATIEGHPDNSTPAILGGFCVALLENGHVHHVRVPVHGAIDFVVFIPDFQLSTEKARAALPKTIDHHDAVYNLARAALLAGSLTTGKLENLDVATGDCLHQPYRFGLIENGEDIVREAKKLDAITYDEMLELASLGAQVLHNRSVEMAKKYNVDLEVVSSFTRNPGTKVKEGSNMEKLLVSGVARDNNCARVAIINLDDTPGTAFKVFSLMAKHNVNIDIILQSVGRDNKKSISFTIRQDDAERVEKILRDAKEMLGYEDISINTKVAKVSIVGAGMASATGVASKMFEALASAGINIRMISTSEIKISVLINEEDSEKAVKAIHEEFFNA